MDKALYVRLGVAVVLDNSDLLCLPVVRTLAYFTNAFWWLSKMPAITPMLW